MELVLVGYYCGHSPFCNLCPAPSPLTPPRPSAHACFTCCSADSATTLDSLSCSRASVLIGSPSETPCPAVSVPPFLLQSPGASDLVSDDKVSISRLHVPPPWRRSAHAADDDDNVPIPRIHKPPFGLVLCQSNESSEITYKYNKNMSVPALYGTALFEGSKVDTENLLQPGSRTT
jgi:hypothetical protein